MDKDTDRESLKSRVLEVAGLVDYQPGAVVSREIVRGAKSTVTVFAFDEGEGLSEHTAPFDAIAQVLEGRVEVRIEGEPMEAGAGQMVIMPAGKPHSLSALGRFKMLLTMIRE